MLGVQAVVDDPRRHTVVNIDRRKADDERSLADEPAMSSRLSESVDDRRRKLRVRRSMRACPSGPPARTMWTRRAEAEAPIADVCCAERQSPRLLTPI